MRCQGRRDAVYVNRVQNFGYVTEVDIFYHSWIVNDDRELKPQFGDERDDFYWASRDQH